MGAGCGGGGGGCICDDEGAMGEMRDDDRRWQQQRPYFSQRGSVVTLAQMAIHRRPRMRLAELRVAMDTDAVSGSVRKRAAASKGTTAIRPFGYAMRAASILLQARIACGGIWKVLGFGMPRVRLTVRWRTR